MDGNTPMFRLDFRVGPDAESAYATTNFKALGATTEDVAPVHDDRGVKTSTSSLPCPECHALEIPLRKVILRSDYEQKQNGFS